METHRFMTLYNVFGGGEMLLRGENVGLEYREIFCTGKWYFGLEWKVVGRGKPVSLACC